ncbi:MAG: hypothetical protein KBD21_00550 [Candidatus Pacebacteria bacterium]|nr:hypothetical protein [Candidatus Paceibacterota bacterium]
MAPEVNTHAMLLRVVAHDLLSPLTAIKWQTELMERPDISREKREGYFATIRSTTELGITITKHAHVAGSVLTNTYTGESSMLAPSKVVESACASLKPQFDRHGIVLEWDVGTSEEQMLDPSLTGLLLWSIAKFFLACVPMNGTVHVTVGAATKGEGNASVYEVVCSSPNAVEPDALVSVFTTLTPRTSLDQEYVFAFLIREVARFLKNVSVSASMEQGSLTLRARFTSDPASS